MNNEKIILEIIDSNNEIVIKKDKFNFDEKISTKSIAQYFTYLYSDKFIFQDNIMYYEQ